MTIPSPINSLINNAVNIEILIFAIVFAISMGIAKLSGFILDRYIKRITQKTKTDIDDKLLAALKKPLIGLIIFVGLYFSLWQVDYVQQNINIMNNIFFILAVIWFVFALNRITKVALEKWLLVSPKFKNMPQLLVRTVKAFVYFVAFIIILNHFHVEITPLVATLGIGGIAVGFALQDTLSNFFAGLHIVSDKPINIGDFIELEGNISGYVEDIGWRSTRIKTLPNTLVIVPNSKIASTTITNYSLPVPEMSVVIQCGVAYTSDLDKVEKVTIETAKKIQKTIAGAVKEFEPFIRYHTFGDSNINFSIILRVETFVDKYLVTHEFIKALKKAYDKGGIEISWPVRKVYYAK